MDIDEVLTTALAKVPDLDPVQDSKIRIAFNDGGYIEATNDRLDDTWDLIDGSNCFRREQISSHAQLEHALDDYQDYESKQASIPPDQKVDIVDRLDTISSDDIPNIQDIIHGKAEPLTHQNPAICYAITQALVHTLTQRAKDLMIPDTFQKAIDVWEDEVNNTAGFMIENFAFMPELSVVTVNTMRELHQLDILAVDKPNIQQLRAQLQPYLEM